MKRAERRRKVKAVSVSESSHPHHHHLRNREVELATLRQLPTNNNFVTENNVLYNLHTFPGELRGFLIVNVTCCVFCLSFVYFSYYIFLYSLIFLYFIWFNEKRKHEY